MLFIPKVLFLFIPLVNIAFTLNPLYYLLTILELPELSFSWTDT